MFIDVRHRVADELAEVVWRLYNAAFDELRSTAVQRHVMVREEFDAVMADRRVVKYLGMDPHRDGEPGALATLTNDLTAVPLISPDYFRRRWPVPYAERRIWYIGFLAIHPRYRGAGVLDAIAGAMCRTVGTSAGAAGVAALDVCRRNEAIYRLPHAIHRMLEARLGPVHSDRMDEQSYWFYEFNAMA